MTNRSKVASSVVLLVLELGLLVFTATHTLNLLSMTLPKDQQSLAFIGLLAFDAGLPAWTLYVLFGARGAAQRGIALLMVAVSLVGVLVSFGADMALNAEANGLAAILDADSTKAVIYALVAVIGANLTATTLLHIVDPSRLAEADEEDAHNMIAAEERKASKEESRLLAAQLAPIRAAARREALQARYLAGLPEALQARFVAIQQARLDGQLRIAQGLQLEEPTAQPRLIAAHEPTAHGTPVMTQAATGDSEAIFTLPEIVNGNGHGNGNGHTSKKAVGRKQ